MADVELRAYVQHPGGLGGIISAIVKIDAHTPLFGLTAIALRAIKAQHPHLDGKPIVALRYDVRAQPPRVAG